MDLKKEFLKKHSFTDLDYRNLIRYEEARKTGKVNMFEYLGMMEVHNINGGSKLASWILSDNNYEEFLSTLGKELENETKGLETNVKKFRERKKRI